MGWYGRDNIKKSYSIGFTEEELQEIEAVYKMYKATPEYKAPEFFDRRTNLLRFLVLHCIDLEKEKQDLIKKAQSAAAGQGGANDETTWTGYFRGAKREGNIVYPEWG
jgi:hypothetical protein